MEDWALIRRLAVEGVPKKQIAERLGISRTTVVKAVASSAPPKYERSPIVTSFSPFEARVRALLEEHPEMPATVRRVTRLSVICGSHRSGSRSRTGRRRCCLCW